jgi:hypothetical protein
MSQVACAAAIREPHSQAQICALDALVASREQVDLQVLRETVPGSRVLDRALPPGTDEALQKESRTEPSNSGAASAERLGSVRNLGQSPTR